MKQQLRFGVAGLVSVVILCVIALALTWPLAANAPFLDTDQGLWHLSVSLTQNSGADWSLDAKPSNSLDPFQENTVFLPLVQHAIPLSYCKSSTIQPAVLGGDEAIPGAWPCVVALILADSASVFEGQYCAGTLLDSDWVITAAHCVIARGIDDIDVAVGKHRLSDSGGERIDVAEIIVHPTYDENTADSDLALLRLATPSTLAPARLIRAEDADDIAPGTEAIVIGWGWAEQGYPDELRRATIPIVADFACSQVWLGLLTPSMLCAGTYIPAYKGACYGDSGGPLFVPDDNGGWEIVGVVSWGNADCKDAYGVFTRLILFHDWIEDTICGRKADGIICNG